MSSIFARAARPVLLVACGMPFASSAQSIDSADRHAGTTTLAPVVVTATRASEPLADTIAQTSLFDAQDIADTNASDALGLLALAPGVQITRNGGPGATSGLYVRGASSAQSLVLIDGVRVESAGVGAAQLSQLMLDEIDHIEVVNGNVSALYGSGAIGGVVQIFTKEGGDHPPRVNVEAEYGSYHTQRQQFGVNGALDREGRTTFDFTVSREKTDGFSSIDPALAPGANPNANGYLNESVAATLRHTFSDTWDGGVRFLQSNGINSFDDAYGRPSDLNESHDRVRSASVFANGRLTDRWTTHFTIAQGQDRANIEQNGVYTNRFNSENRQYLWQNDVRLAAGHKLLFGYEHTDQSLDSDQLDAPDRHVNSIFAGYVGRIGASQFQANLRRDQYSDFGGANSYYLGYGYNFDAHWKASASYAASFRAPSFDDLYYPFSGNPSIQPERSHSVEAALQYASSRLGVLRLTAFQTRYSNLIDYVADGSGFYIAQNVGRAKVQGIEGSWAGQVGATDVRASFTLQNPVDETNHEELTRRARRFAAFTAHRSIGHWRVGGEWIVSGARSDYESTLAGYGLVNLSARYDITKSWYVDARIDNLFDKDYELAYSYNTPRRGAYLTIGWRQL
ncbi:TonB-dependent receptor domain-containing protein [Caballeronia telluris]|uniref:Vitamin B12 receptor BtuB n=1 Tax=Caballeronia telluris TaxID=326475 RepID=A0A158HXG9_9BURK|nr:TonB-dependent receptor [Caballeronia telluris]SAL48773.1 vitamin B12 receptor BtuB [Caballeronia telluris]